MALVTAVTEPNTASLHSQRWIPIDVGTPEVGLPAVDLAAPAAG
jgi:hypothetical protein